MSDTQPNEQNRSAERSLAGETGSDLLAIIAILHGMDAARDLQSLDAKTSRHIACASLTPAFLAEKRRIEYDERLIEASHLRTIRNPYRAL